jgi:hypothetical protein
MGSNTQRNTMGGDNANEQQQDNNEKPHNHHHSRNHFSKVILVDLAGNERDSARNGTENEALLRAEGIDVNASLAALSACLRHRAKGSSKNRASDSDVPANNSDVKASSSSGAGLFRVSALTRLLKEPLTTAKIVFLACCSPVASSAIITGQTLTYAAMVKRIKTSAEDSAVLLEQGIDRFPIEFVAHHVLVKRGQIPRSNEGLTVYLHELRVSVVRIMVSHR